MKKVLISIISFCMCCMLVSQSSLSIKAEESVCSTCTIDDTDGTIKKTIEELEDYTDYERQLVLNSVESNTIFKEKSDFIQTSERVNIYKNNLDSSYFTVSYIQKDENNQVTETLTFNLNKDYIVDHVYSSHVENGDILLEDYTTNTMQIYSVQPRVIDCNTYVCSRYEYRGTDTNINKFCEALVGAVCSAATSFSGFVISDIVCYAGKILACSPAPAGKYCVAGSWKPICPY